MPEEQAKKAFDLKELGERLKAAGAPIAEEALHAAVKCMFDWVEDGVKLTPSKVDDFALAVLPPLRAFVDSKIDGISA